jgi:hypothetical protein
MTPCKQLACLPLEDDSTAALTPAPRAGNHSLYLRRALTHPYSLFVMLTAAAFGLIGGFASVLLLGVAVELLTLMVIPHCQFFRKHIDQTIERTKRAEAARARRLLMPQLEEIHRQELERIDILVEKIPDCLDLSRLTSSYVRLALAYRASKESLAAIDRHALQNEIQLLEAAQETAPPRLRKLHLRRAAIARQRADRYDRTRENLEVIRHQLATIVELIQLMHEQTMTPFDTQEMNEEVDRLLADLEAHEGALRELSEELAQ